MGYGLGASIGAALGRPDKKVINITGDGSFKMNSTELATVSKYKVPIVQLVLNNHTLGMVRQWQDLFFQGRFPRAPWGRMWISLNWPVLTALRASVSHPMTRWRVLKKHLA